MRSADAEGGGGGDEGTSGAEPKGTKAEPGGDGGKGREEKRVELSQAALNRMIDEKFREAHEKAERKLAQRFGVESLDDLEAKVKGAGAKGGPATDDEKAEAITEALGKAKKEWESERAILARERDTALELANRIGVEHAIVAAASKAGAHDPDDVVRALHGRVRLDPKTGRALVLTEGGNPAIGSNGPLTVEDAVADVRSAKPHLFRAETKAGAGDRGGGGGSNDSKTLTRAEWDKLGPLEKAERIRNGVRPVD